MLRTQPLIKDDCTSIAGCFFDDHVEHSTPPIVSKSLGNTLANSRSLAKYTVPEGMDALYPPLNRACVGPSSSGSAIVPPLLKAHS